MSEYVISKASIADVRIKRHHVLQSPRTGHCIATSAEAVTSSTWTLDTRGSLSFHVRDVRFGVPKALDSTPMPFLLWPWGQPGSLGLNAEVTISGERFEYDRFIHAPRILTSRLYITTARLMHIPAPP